MSKPRGNMENRIKERQLMLFADRASCHSFVANHLRLLLSSAACVLVEILRRTALVSWCTIRNRQSRSTLRKGGGMSGLAHGPDRSESARFTRRLKKYGG